MHPLRLIAILCLVLVIVEAKKKPNKNNVVCGPKKTKKSITLKVGDSFSFKTQKGKKYKKKAKCIINYKRAKKQNCELHFSCTSFNLASKAKSCKKGDYMSFSGDKTKYCKKNKPDITTDGSFLKVTFKSDKKSKGSTGAKCTISCDEPATTSAPGNRKYLASLAYSFDSSLSPFCAGALVSSRWVVTSASCSYSYNDPVDPSKVVIGLGESAKLTALEVNKIVVHTGYSQTDGEDNIALWKLKNAVDITENNSTLCLPAKDSQQTGTATIVGWRITELPGSLSETLEEREVDLEDCGQEGILCSSAATTQCGGDYGGPLLQGTTLVGAAVSDSGCAKDGKGVFTQISKYTDWIQDTIANNGEDQACTTDN